MTPRRLLALGGVVQFAGVLTMNAAVLAVGGVLLMSSMVCGWRLQDRALEARRRDVTVRARFDDLRYSAIPVREAKGSAR